MAWPKLKQRPIVEDERSLSIYAAITKAGRPLSVRELIDATGINDGSLYPKYLQPRVHNGLLVDGQHDGTSIYDLTPKGLKQVQVATT